MAKRHMLEGFIRYVQNDRCKFRVQIDKVAAIEKTVKRILERIVDKVAELNPAFEVSKIVEGGSFFEGTKICAPDEFDFMIVMKHLSLPGFTKLKNGCAPWYKKIELSQKSETYKAYTGDQPRKNLSVKQMTRQFWNYVEAVCTKETISEAMSFGTIKIKDCRLRKLLLHFVEHSPIRDKPCDPKYTDSEAIVPLNCLEIGVDLMLAIDYPNTSEIVHSCGFPARWTDLVKNVGCHLVAKTCQSQSLCTTCWHVTLAYAELHLMRNLDDRHKGMYRILKYLLIRELHKKYQNKCANMSSYMIKNAFLFHVYEQNGCTEYSSTCVFSILEYLACNLREGAMPCFFSRNINTWGHLLKFPSLFEDVNNEKTVGYEWYGVLWLELWRRVVMKAGKLLTELKSPDDEEVLNKFYLMKESMMVLVQNYCTEGIRQTPNISESIQRPTVISDTDLNERFAWYCKRLEDLFKVKFGDLSSLPNPLSFIPK